MKLSNRRSAQCCYPLVALLGVAAACDSGTLETTGQSRFTLSGVEFDRADGVPNVSPPLPRDPAVHREVLDNGVTFISKHYATTSGAFRLLLVVRAGRLSESPDEEGFAHLIEHLAIRGGSETFTQAEQEALLLRVDNGWGAWTRNDYTEFSIPLSGADAPLAEQVILMLREWAAGMRFEADAVSAERSIVLHEEREHLDEREFYRLATPLLLPGSAYARRLARSTALGVAPSPPGALEAFYRRWYHPGNLAVIAVGDFDERRVKHQIRAAFGSLPPRAQGVRLGRASVPLEAGLRVSALATSASSPQLQLIMQQPARPRTDEAAVREGLLDVAVFLALQRRLSDMARNANAPVGLAGDGFLFPLPSELAGVRCFVGVRNQRFEEATEVTLRELRRLRLHPPSATELQAALSTLTTSLRSRSTQTTLEDDAARMVRAFVTGETAMNGSVQRELQLRLLAEISGDDVRRRLAQWLERSDRHLVLLAPPGVPLPTQEKLAAIVAAVNRERPEASARADPPLAELLDSRPRSGPMGEREEFSAIGAYRWKLDNGAVVLFKPSASAGLRMFAFRPGGWATQHAFDPEAIQLATAGVAAAGLASHRALPTRLFLATRGVGLEPHVGAHESSLTGHAGPEQVEALMQALHLMVRDPGRDEVGFDRYLDRRRERRTEYSHSKVGFRSAVEARVWSESPRRAGRSDGGRKELDFRASRRLFSERFGRAGEFNFVFVGQTDLAALEGLIATYLASLPPSGREAVVRPPHPQRPPGVTRVRMSAAGQATSRVHLEFHGRAALGSRLYPWLEALRLVLRQALRDALRTRAAATYGVETWWKLAPPEVGEYSLGLEFECEPERAEELKARALSVVAALREQGPSETSVSEIRQSWKRAEGSLVDRFWLDELASAQRHGEDPNRILDTLRDAARSLTQQKLRAFARRMLDPQRYVDAVQMGG